MTIKLNHPLAPDLAKLTGYLSQVNERGWYTNFGPLHDQLTRRLEEKLGVNNLLLVSNGTAALQVAAKTLGIKKAITTPFSFVATSSALLWQGIDIAFCDIDEDSYNLSPDSIEAALDVDNSFDGVVATHVYGNPCDVERIDDIAKRKQKKVIYDAAHAFSVTSNGRSILQYGDASTLSFHATKVFHTVEGGAIVFKSRSDYEKAKQLINFGIDVSDGTIRAPGINAKLSEYQCAVGLVLLDSIDSVIANRSHLFKVYRDELDGIADMPVWNSSASLNGAYMPIYLSDEQQQHNLLREMESHNIQIRRYFTPSLDFAFPSAKSFGCEISQEKAKGVFCLPLHNYMTETQVRKVAAVVRKAVE